ncbi:MAG: hypothetical protein HY313_04125 [Acidobacteria bacterium]|nr:hypothetical protein [Acidobacteriota bacterium]
MGASKKISLFAATVFSLSISFQSALAQLSPCGSAPSSLSKPIGCKDAVPVCKCDAEGKNCRWEWICASPGSSSVVQPNLTAPAQTPIILPSPTQRGIERRSAPNVDYTIHYPERPRLLDTYEQIFRIKQLKQATETIAADSAAAEAEHKLRIEQIKQETEYFKAQTELLKKRTELAEKELRQEKEAERQNDESMFNWLICGDAQNCPEPAKELTDIRPTEQPLDAGTEQLEPTPEPLLSLARARLDEARTRYRDLDEVMGVDLPLTPALWTTLLYGERGVDVLYWLAKHPGEWNRIADMEKGKRADQPDVIVLRELILIRWKLFPETRPAELQK